MSVTQNLPGDCYELIKNKKRDTQNERKGREIENTEKRIDKKAGAN